MRKNNRRIRELCTVAITSALLCISALVYIPMTVPITLQILVLFLSLFTLGGRLTAVAAAVYILIGTIGLPVFSGFSGGIARLFDATGGYIIGMLLGALLYWLLEYVFPKKDIYKILNAVAVLALIYLTGTLWYAFVYGGAESLGAVFVACVLPFIIPDAVKIYIAFIISRRMPRP